MIPFHVAQLLQEPQGATRRYSLDEPAAEVGESSVVAPVRGTVTLIRTGRGILVDCRFSTEVAAECARCLEECTTPVSGQFQEEFVPTVDVRSGMPLAEESDEFRIGENHVLDLGEPIRQHVLTEAPLQPLCRRDCRGLCEQCGADLNLASCDCLPRPGASPFDALRTLLNQGDERAPRV